MKLGKSAAKKVPEFVVWRPDFRDTEDLPDIKIIRTGFFVGAFFTTVALALVLFVSFRELQKKSTQENLDALQVEISGYEVEHARVVALNKKFMESMKRIEEVDATRSNQVVFSDLMLSAGQALREGMALSLISYKDDSITLEGLINVPAEEASIVVDAFMNELKTNNVDQGFFPVYNLNSLERKDGGGISFSITMSEELKDQKKGKK